MTSKNWLKQAFVCKNLYTQIQIYNKCILMFFLKKCLMLRLFTVFNEKNSYIM